MDHSKLIVQSDQMLISVMRMREKERKSENKRDR